VLAEQEGARGAGQEGHRDRPEGIPPAQAGHEAEQGDDQNLGGHHQRGQHKAKDQPLAGKAKVDEGQPGQQREHRLARRDDHRQHGAVEHEATQIALEHDRREIAVQRRAGRELE